MCGIAGIFDTVEFRLISNSCIMRMLNTMQYRGPDGKHFLSIPGLFIGHTHLAITDPTNCQQPLSSDNHNKSICVNGMIYNFKALRQQLEMCGHTFKSENDTEVILNGWQEWKNDLFNKIEGFFAAALWDNELQELTLIRDRWGKKPLFWTIHDDLLIFSSDIASILHAIPHTPAIRYNSLVDFLTMGYVFDPYTIYNNIYTVPPAHMLRVRKSQSPVLHQWWNLNTFQENAISRSRSLPMTTIPSYTKELSSCIKQSVHKRTCNSAGTPSLCLSSGVDSNLILTMIEKDIPVNCLTASYGIISDDMPEEFYHANQLARHLGRVCTQVPQDMPDFDMWQQGFSNPIADPAAFPLISLSNTSRLMGSKVLITGDGGDEVFLGYKRYSSHAFMLFLEKHLWLKSSLQHVSYYGSKIPHSRCAKSMNTLNRMLSCSSCIPELIMHTSSIASLAKVRNLLNKDIQYALNDYTPVSHLQEHWSHAPANANILQKIQYVDLKTWLPCRMLAKVDSSSSAVGMEARTPFLDTEVAFMALSIPEHYTTTMYSRKKALYKVASQELPDFPFMKRKTPFSCPISYWMHKLLSPESDTMLSILNVLQNSHLFNMNEIIHIINSWRATGEHSSLLWAIICFAVFLDHNRCIPVYNRNITIL